MSWSDAARAAALEARRLHSKAKGVVSGWSTSYDTSHIGAAYRKEMAQQLKRIRKGAKYTAHTRFVPPLHAQDAMNMAVLSTRIRNWVKKR